jgi:hypothetical protein
VGEVSDEPNGTGAGEYWNLRKSLHEVTELCRQDGCNSWIGWDTSDAHLYQLRGHHERNTARR